MVNRFHHLPGKCPYSPKVKSERPQYLLLGHCKGLQIILAFTASYTYPPVYFLVMSMSLKSSSMVSYCTGQDKVWPIQFPMPGAFPLHSWHWHILQENSTQRLYLDLGSSLRLEDLFPPYHPSSIPSPNATSQLHFYKRSPLYVRTREDHEKHLVNGNIHHWCAPTVCKVLYSHFCIESSNILRGDFKASFKHEYHSSSSGKNRDSGRLFIFSSLTLLVHPRMPKSLS